MTNIHHTVLYTGVTSDLFNRIIQHKENHFPLSFTAQFNAHKLVYYETFPTIEDAIAKEKKIKGGSRRKKIALVNSMNPQWRDLFEDLDVNY